MIGKHLVFILMAILVTACGVAGGVRVDNVPMYGQPKSERPQKLKEADEKFIKEVTAKIPDRKEASKQWWMQAEKFMAQGNLDYAMRRYNQSWLLDPNNYQPYWGFARVSLELGKIQEGIDFLNKAKEIINDPYQEVALLADTGTAYTVLAKTAATEQKKKYFNLANENFASSTKLDPNYANSWRRWAFSLYGQGNYKEAWIKVHRARALNAKPFPESFILKLINKEPEPKNG